MFEHETLIKKEVNEYVSKYNEYISKPVSKISYIDLAKKKDFIITLLLIEYGYCFKDGEYVLKDINNNGTEEFGEAEKSCLSDSKIQINTEERYINNFKSCLREWFKNKRRI